MKQKIFLTLILILVASQSWAIENFHNQLSSAPESSRFEIVQSEIAAKVTLKIDKYTGNVFQLVKGDKGLFWELIAAEKHNEDKAVAGKVNYQIFTSGLAVKMTYLLNVNTGATWQLAEDSEVGVFWQALE